MATLKKMRFFGILLCFAAGNRWANGGDAPIVPPNSVVNNASFAAGTNPLAPGTIASIFGTNLDDGSKNAFPSFGADGALLTTLGGASVTVNGIPAPMFSAFPGQLNVQIPLELANANSATVVVSVGGQMSAPEQVSLSSLSPGIFTAAQTGNGQGVIQIANTTTFAAPAGSIPGSAARAAKAGEFITIYCTGLGAVNNPPGTGKPASSNPLSKTLTTPRVSIGGVPAAVSFSGLAPGFVGLYQVDVEIPQGVPGGSAVPVKLTISGVQSNTVTIAVAAPVANKIAGGEQHTCAVTSAGAVLCWGRNQYGQLGNGATTTSTTPVPVTGLSSGVTSISAGANFTCALMQAGTVMCWGYNADGEVGNRQTTDAHTPVQVLNSAGTAPLSGIVAIASGHYQTCGVTSAGTLLCWGSDGENDLGPETPSPHGLPVEVANIPSNIIGASGGSDYTFALTSTGEVWGWGIDHLLGIGSQAPNYGTPVQLSLKGVAAIAAGFEDSCAVLDDATLWCWGANGAGEVGNNTNNEVDTPVKVASGISAASGGDDDTCALTTAGGVLCWGSSSNGQNGTGPKGSTDTFTPQQVVGLTSGVIEIASGYRHNCAITSTGGVLCWGFNITGQLGNGNTNDSRTPVAVVGVGGIGLLNLF